MPAICWVKIHFPIEFRCGLRRVWWILSKHYALTTILLDFPTWREWANQICFKLLDGTGHLELIKLSPPVPQSNERRTSWCEVCQPQFCNLSCSSNYFMPSTSPCLFLGFYVTSRMKSLCLHFLWQKFVSNFKFLVLNRKLSYLSLNTLLMCYV